MFVFISHLTVPEADRPALERHFQERSRLVDGFPGFLYLQLLTPQGGPRRRMASRGTTCS